MSKVLSVTDSELQELISESTQPLLIDFWAEWCGPCKMVAPVLDQLNDEYGDNIKIVKINVDENKEMTAKYGVRSIPTFIVVKDNELVFRHSGAAPKSFFEEKLKKMLK